MTREERLQLLDDARLLNGPAETTHYLGSSEVHWTDDSHLSVKRYVGGVMVLQSTAQPQTEWQYLFFDTQGSVVAQTSAGGKVVGSGAGAMAWDAFGARRNLDGSLLSQAEQWTQNSTGETTRHGYTGHEQLDNSGLVHMNGRIYDPYLARFVQGDPLVEDPYNGQSLNRYSYVMNNPMSLTDPTGFSTIRSRQMYRQAAAMAITMVTGAYASGQVGLARTTILVSGGFASGAVASGNLKGGVLGAFQAMVNVQIGNTFASADMAARFTSGELYAMHTLTHAVSGGVFSSLNGGKFGHGFVSAGVSTAFSPVIEMAPTSAGRVALAGLIGGVASKAVGGKFGSGALTAAFAQAFNGEQFESITDEQNSFPITGTITDKQLKSMVRQLKKSTLMNDATVLAQARITSYCNSGNNCSEINLAAFNAVNFSYGSNFLRGQNPTNPGPDGFTNATNDYMTMNVVKIYPGALIANGKANPVDLASTMIHEFVHETTTTVRCPRATGIRYQGMAQTRSLTV